MVIVKIKIVNEQTEDHLVEELIKYFKLFV